MWEELPFSPPGQHNPTNNGLPMREQTNKQQRQVESTRMLKAELHKPLLLAVLHPAPSKRQSFAPRTPLTQSP